MSQSSASGAAMWGWCLQDGAGSECVGKKLAGMECDASAQCQWTASPVGCINGICQCKTGLRMNKQGLCVPSVLNIEQILLCFAILALLAAGLTVLYSAMKVYPKKGTLEYLQDTPRLSYHDRYHTAQFKQFNEEMDEVLSTSLRDSDLRARRRIESRVKSTAPGERALRANDQGQCPGPSKDIGKIAEKFGKFRTF